MKEIGIFGGTFDPPHRGHIAIAEAALRQCGLDEVWLMVSPENPFKSGRRITPEADRLRMAALAVKELPEDLRDRIRVSDFETRLPRPTYTVATLRALREAYPDCRFRLIIGGDNMSAFSKWREPEEIIRDYGLIVYPRPGDETWDPTQMPPECVILKDVPLMPVSSTEIRECLRSGSAGGCDRTVAPGVARYINEHHIYG